MNTYWMPELIRCLRCCGAQLIRSEFAETYGFALHTVYCWEKKIEHQSHTTPRLASLRKLDEIASSLSWSPDYCRGMCGRSVTVPRDAVPECDGHVLCNGATVYCGIRQPTRPRGHVDGRAVEAGATGEFAARAKRSLTTGASLNGRR